MKPEYIGIGNFDTYNYVYAYCNCRLPVDYAIKWPLIKDGKPHSYTCTCEDCGTTVSVIAKSYDPEVYKGDLENIIYELSQTLGVSYSFIADEIKEIEKALKALPQESCNDAISRQGAIDALYKMLHDCFGADEEELDAVITTLNELSPVTPQPKMQEVLDKIRAEMEQIKEAEYQIYGKGSWRFVDKCLDIIDKYKTSPTGEEVEE